MTDHPQANTAVVAFLNELGKAMQEQNAVALVAHERREAARRALHHPQTQDAYRREAS